jgi:hypothetical protein
VGRVGVGGGPPPKKPNSLNSLLDKGTLYILLSPLGVHSVDLGRSQAMI